MFVLGARRQPRSARASGGSSSSPAGPRTTPVSSGGWRSRSGRDVPCEVDIASEWRYRNPRVDEHTLVIGISQSGETADTLGALRLARELGARTLAITNSPGSQITREVDAVLYTHAGIEIGVAATKTFTAQLALLYLLALRHRPAARGARATASCAALMDEVRALPQKLVACLEGLRRGRGASPSATTTSPSSSISGATSGCRCAWRAR